MNQPSSTDTISSAERSAEAISRRAYEIWEREGRPDGCDLRHWLEAEQELSANRTGGTTQRESSGSARFAQPGAPRNTGTDTRPLQGTRAASAASRESKRSSATPFGGDRQAAGNGQSTGKRKASAPSL